MTEAAAPSPGGYALDGVAVRGVVSAVPRRKVGNDAFVARFGEAAVADVVKMIGVETRHWVDETGTASDLCQAAAETLLARLDWPADSVDALIFVSQTPDHRLPATACVLHGKLGLSTHAQAFDVNLGCSGYVYGLWLAGVLVKAGLKRVLLLAGDTISRTIDPSDRGTALVFGDAGSATAVEAAPGAPAMHFRLGTDGKGAGHLIIPDGAYRAAEPDPRRENGPDPASLFMDGGEVFTFTLRAVPKLVKDTLADAGIEGDSVDAYLLHQANRFMLKHLGKKIGADGERLPINIDRFGNTSSATIPLLLTTDMADRVTGAPTRVMLVGFGVGFSWGAALVDLAPLACAETLYL
jgi:3-oxoacyl-[acyl-carrier-protein] synthase-3